MLFVLRSQIHLQSEVQNDTKSALSMGREIGFDILIEDASMVIYLKDAVKCGRDKP